MSTNLLVVGESRIIPSSLGKFTKRRSILEGTTLATSGSLFDRTAASPLGDAVDWLSNTLLGSAATTLCVLAIASVGLLMLWGRLPIRRGYQVVIGCFLLLGAPLVVATFVGIWRQASPAPQPSVSIKEPVDPRGHLPESEYDPYAGASMRRD